MNHRLRIQSYQQACVVLGIDPRIATEISRLGASCAREYAKAGLNADDWSQTLWAGLLGGLGSYNSEHASERTFTRRIIQNQAVSFIRRLKAGKRDCGDLAYLDQNGTEGRQAFKCAAQHTSRRNLTRTINFERTEFGWTSSLRYSRCDRKDAAPSSC
jgi:DNA-directed RNA polymerase specialized sigma24 family protein